MEVQNLAGMGITQARTGTSAQPPQFDANNVNDQLGSTLNQGGLLMRMAQSKGQGLAAQRGLGNSTIGIDAAQRAMVDAALPIAQQNAQQANQRTMQASGFTQEKDMAGINAGLTKERDQLLYQQQLGTLDAQGKQRLTEMDKELANSKALNDQQYNQQRGLNDQQNAFTSSEAQKDRTQQLTVLEKNAGIEMAQMAQQVVANTHGMYMTSIDGAVDSYNERYAAVMGNTTMPATDKANFVANLKTELNSTLNMYQQMYSNINTIRPDWTSFPTISVPGATVK